MRRGLPCPATQPSHSLSNPKTTARRLVLFAVDQQVGAALWETIVEHELGYRGRSGYPVRLCLVCSICFGIWGVRDRAPLSRSQGCGAGKGCDDHVSTAFAVGLAVRRLIPAGDAFGALLDLYGVGEMSLSDATDCRAGGGLRSGADASPDHSVAPF